jgi:NADPH:quinone reductase-like Zn-dependent oxidoreductase
VLVEVTAAALNPLDWHFTTGRPYFMRLMLGRRGPKQSVRGADVAGRVVALGDGVTGFAVGDRVAGMADGSFAEFAVATTSSIAVVPDGLGDDDAAAIPLAAITALQALRDQAEVTASQRVLVIGAGGGVGVYAVQLAAAMGAVVTGVCSAGKVELVRSLGAANVIDYEAADWTDGTTYDAIVDNVGTERLSACRRALTDTGIYVMIGGPKSNPWIDPIGRVIAGKAGFAFRSQRFRQFTAVMSSDDLRILWEHVEAGELRAVVDRTISLDGVADAVELLASGHARGKTVVRIPAAKLDPEN